MSDLAKKLAGRFIVIDGPDGAGKSTQVGLLADFLRAEGVDVRPVRDPGGTNIGDKVRAILLDNAHGEMAVRAELMLYMASRAQLVAEVVKPALAAGQCVLADRFVSSTGAYQGAGGLDAKAIRSVASVAIEGVWPDLTVILDLPPEAGLSRLPRKADRMESKDLAFHRKVRELFLKQAERDPKHFAVVDAAGSAEEVQQRLRTALRNRF